MPNASESLHAEALLLACMSCVALAAFLATCVFCFNPGMLAGEASRDLSLDFGVFALAFVFNPKNAAYQRQLGNAIDLATDDEVVVIQERAMRPHRQLITSCVNMS